MGGVARTAALMTDTADVSPLLTVNANAAALADACFHSADLVEGITAFEESP